MFDADRSPLTQTGAARQFFLQWLATLRAVDGEGSLDWPTAELSRPRDLEHQRDLHLSMLLRYVKAFGGRVELTAVLDDGPIVTLELLPIRPCKVRRVLAQRTSSG